jgi:protein-ribulosamine 3-kinase
VSNRIDKAHPQTLDEDEFGQWRPVCNRFGAEYLEAYHSYVQISPPEEDYDGRLDLYKL